MGEMREPISFKRHHEIVSIPLIFPAKLWLTWASPQHLSASAGGRITGDVRLNGTPLCLGRTPLWHCGGPFLESFARSPHGS